MNSASQGRQKRRSPSSFRSPNTLFRRVFSARRRGTPHRFPALCVLYKAKITGSRVFVPGPPDFPENSHPSCFLEIEKKRPEKGFFTPFKAQIRDLRVEKAQSMPKNGNAKSAGTLPLRPLPIPSRLNQMVRLPPRRVPWSLPSLNWVTKPLSSRQAI